MKGFGMGRESMPIPPHSCERGTCKVRACWNYHGAVPTRKQKQTQRKR